MAGHIVKAELADTVVYHKTEQLTVVLELYWRQQAAVPLGQKRSRREALHQ